MIVEAVLLIGSGVAVSAGMALLLDSFAAFFLHLQEPASVIVQGETQREGL